MVDVIKIIQSYYTKDSELYNLLLKHSVAVANKALQVAEAANLVVDRDFVREAAMLHDIGVCETYAPKIYCVGERSYISHGIIGAEMLRSLGMEEHARVCERHTGAGLTAEEILRDGLPLPAKDMLPETVEECLICYADKFFSKSNPNKELSIGMIEQGLAAYGDEVLRRFKDLRGMFEQ